MVYLEATDIIAVTIALTVSLVLVISAVLRNVQLTTQRDYWKYQYDELKHYVEYEAL